jgi:predicted transcriptional regulator
MTARTTPGREAQLEEMLIDANRQLLERDQEVLNILATRDEELARAAETIDRLQSELKRHARDVEDLNRAIAEMQATRVWRLAIQYRALRTAASHLVPRMKE